MRNSSRAFSRMLIINDLYHHSYHSVCPSFPSGEDYIEAFLYNHQDQLKDHSTNTRWKCLLWYYLCPLCNSESVAPRPQAQLGVPQRRRRRAISSSGTPWSRPTLRTARASRHIHHHNYNIERDQNQSGLPSLVRLFSFFNGILIIIIKPSVLLYWYWQTCRWWIIQISLPPRELTLMFQDFYWIFSWMKAKSWRRILSFDLFRWSTVEDSVTAGLWQTSL